MSSRRPDARVVWPPAERQTASAAIEALMRERGLPGRFPREVERAARRARDRGLDVLAEGRRDLTALATFTIDPSSAQDFDDAISAAEIEADGVRVWVHIADVGAYVPEGSPVDLEARRRGTSVYVPGAVEPMLPDPLSSDACSLVAAAERLAVTVELELRGAEVVSAAFYRSVIRSDERLDYDRVDRIFARREAAREPWGAALAAARAAAAALQGRREQSGSLVVESQEPEFSFDGQGNVTEVRARVQSESHRLVEHLMIAANEAVARLLAQRRVPCLYRVHERPEPERIERLAAQLESLGVPTPALPSPMSASQAAAVVGSISRLVDNHVRRTGRGQLALNSLVLRSLKQAYYSPRNIGHAGLRSSAYCHFTSPIRRYPDLVCHRALLSATGGGEPPPPARELGELGTWTSEREREAMTIERDADDVARCFALERELLEGGFDLLFAGEVTGLISGGAFVAFGDPGAAGLTSSVYEGLLPARRLPTTRSPREPDQASRAGRPAGRPAGRRAAGSARASAPQARTAGGWWEINELGTVLREQATGTSVRLADQIAVRVARVDPARGRVDLLAGDEPQDGARPDGGRDSRRGGGPDGGRDSRRGGGRDGGRGGGRRTGQRRGAQPGGGRPGRAG